MLSPQHVERVVELLVDVEQGEASDRQQANLFVAKVVIGRTTRQSSVQIGEKSRVT